MAPRRKPSKDPALALVHVSDLAPFPPATLAFTRLTHFKLIPDSWPTQVQFPLPGTPSLQTVTQLALSLHSGGVTPSKSFPNLPPLPISYMTCVVFIGLITLQKRLVYCGLPTPRRLTP